MVKTKTKKLFFWLILRRFWNTAFVFVKLKIFPSFPPEALRYVKETSNFPLSSTWVQASPKCGSNQIRFFTVMQEINWSQVIVF